MEKKYTEKDMLVLKIEGLTNAISDVADIIDNESVEELIRSWRQELIGINAQLNELSFPAPIGNDAWQEPCKALMKYGETIVAVKLCRKLTGKSLREAKEGCESL